MIKENTIMLDFDDLKSPANVMRRLPLVCKTLDLHPIACYYTYSSSKRGIHVVIAFRESLAATEIVTLQAIFGSDWRRETFNLIRARHSATASAFWQSRWNVLYAEKLRAGR